MPPALHLNEVAKVGDRKVRREQIISHINQCKKTIAELERGVHSHEARALTDDEAAEMLNCERNLLAQHQAALAELDDW